MSSDVYTGVWINWSEGTVLGTTLTVSSRDGALLLSFVAAFVTLVGSQLWRSVSFLLHQTLATRKACSGVHYQRQNILRNTASPVGAAWSLLLVAWSWRKIDRRASLGVLPLTILASAYVLAFAVLAVFSSQVARGLSTVRLLRDVDCGIWISVGSADENKSNATLRKEMWDYRRKITFDTLRASAYSRACYLEEPSSLDCNTFPKPALPWSADVNVTCPFVDATLCLNGHSVRMDTGLLDSHTHLGINAPARNRVSIRKETICTPLPTGEEYTSVVTGEDAEYYGFDNNTLIRYEYGPTIVGNHSYLYNNLAVDVGVGYTLTSLRSGDGSWEPITGLVKTDADVSIIFVAINAVRFSEPNNDPVFAAHLEHLNPNTGDIFWYDSDRYVSPIACTDRYQICKSDGSCTRLVAASQLLGAATTSLNLNAVQIATAQRLSFLVPVLNIQDVVWTRNTNALRAHDTLTGLDQGAIPDNQWEIEVKGWFTDTLARLQHLVQEYPNVRSSGLADVGHVFRIWDNTSLHTKPEDIANNLAHKNMCTNQIVNDSQTTMSFSVLGLATIFALGGAIIFTSLVLEAIVAFAQRKLKKGLVARSTWIQDDKLNIQMRLFESCSLGLWTSRDSAVPTTMSRETIDAWTGLVDADAHVNAPENLSKPSAATPPLLVEDLPSKESGASAAAVEINGR